jgi:hypothetical protein
LGLISSFGKGKSPVAYFSRDKAITFKDFQQS